VRPVVGARLLRKFSYAFAAVSPHDGVMDMRISAIVDACFRLIMDGVSASSWTRRDARKRGLNVAQTPRLTAAKCDREALGFDFGLLSWGSLSIGPCQAAGGPPPERYRVTDFVGNLIRSSK
jgi:hypothetical protein